MVDITGLDVDVNLESPIKVVHEKKEILMKKNVFEICQIYVSERTEGIIFKKKTLILIHFDGKEYRTIAV